MASRGYGPALRIHPTFQPPFIRGRLRLEAYIRAVIIELNVDTSRGSQGLDHAKKL